MSVVLPVDVPPATQDVAAFGDGDAQRLGLIDRHDAGGDVVVEREDGDGGLADREGRRGNDGRQQALEPFARLGQLGRDARAAGMNLGADMMGDEANDPLAIGGRQPLACIGKSLGQPVDPEPSIGVEHHLDDRRVFQKSGDGGAERGAQHARAPQYRLGLLVRTPSSSPLAEGPRQERPRIGDD